MENKKEFHRMVQWLLVAVSLYVLAAALASVGTTFFPQVQTVSWKLGHLTTGAFVGYWIDRTAFRSRITANSSPVQEIRRAVIIVGTMIAVALGM